MTRGQHEEDDDAQADHRQAVAEEAAERAVPGARRLGSGRAGGGGESGIERPGPCAPQSSRMRGSATA